LTGAFGKYGGKPANKSGSDAGFVASATAGGVLLVAATHGAPLTSNIKLAATTRRQIRREGRLTSNVMSRPP
jgi:hypothetical protein